MKLSGFFLGVACRYSSAAHNNRFCTPGSGSPDKNHDLGYCWNEDDQEDKVGYLLTKNKNKDGHFSIRISSVKEDDDEVSSRYVVLYPEEELPEFPFDDEVYYFIDENMSELRPEGGGGVDESYWMRRHDKRE